MKTRKRTLYVEGCGKGEGVQQTECRKAFQKLFTAAGIEQKPSVVACGPRREAYKRFCVSLAHDREEAWLLVDAEEPVTGDDPWLHISRRLGDELHRPDGATDRQLHLMAVTTETWLIADRAALKAVFGPKLDESKLPPVNAALESVPKDKINDALNKALKGTSAGAYDKGKHTFKILAAVRPEKLAVLPWAARFLTEMKKR